MKAICGAALLFFAACSTTGPYVQNISVDVDGNLTIDKCLIEYSGWTGGLSSTNCTSQQLKIHPANGQPPPTPTLTAPTPIPPPK